MKQGQRLAEFSQENALVIANTLFQFHKRRLYTWTSSDGEHCNQINYILCSQKWRSSIQLAETKPGADCGSDHELLIAKFRLKLKKVGIPLDHSKIRSKIFADGDCSPDHELLIAKFRLKLKRVGKLVDHSGTT